MILLTGASGFLGRALATGLAGDVITVGRNQPDLNGMSVRHITADLTESSSVDVVEAALRSFDISHVIHAAAVTPWSQEPDFSKDMQMAHSITEITNRLAVKQFYFLSGWIVYAMNGNPPFSEESPIGPSTEYGKSKIQSEQFFLDNIANSAVLNIRLASVYGQGQTSPGLIPNFTHEAFAEKRLLLNAKQTRRDYVYIDDFVSAIKTLLKTDIHTNMNLNLGSGSSHSVFEVAQTIQKICKESYDVDVLVEEAGELQESVILDNCMSVEKLKQLHIETGLTSLEAGLRAYISWGKNESIF